MSEKRILHFIAICFVFASCSSSPTHVETPAVLESPGEFQIVIVHAELSRATLNGEHAVGIRDHRVVAIGTSSELANHCREKCRVIDAHGRFLMPGFHDSHIHLIDSAEREFQFQTKRTNLADILRDLALYGEANPGGDWITGGDWVIANFNGHLPNKKDLDLIVRDRPVALHDASGHQLWVNSKALELAGINRSTQDPAGGRIERDPHGEPTGILIEAATYSVREKMPKPTLEQYEKYIQRGQNETLSRGITSVDGAQVPLTMQQVQAYRELEREGLLHQRSFLWGNLRATEDDFDEMVDVAHDLQNQNDGLVQISAFKGFVDGTLTGKTAAMVAPYLKSDEKGLLKISQNQLNQAVLRANRAGFPAALHAMGDEAVRMTLESFEYSESGLGHKMPNRVEHATIVDTKDFARFKKLGAIASVQPSFMFYASPEKFPMFKLLGEEQLAHLYPWRSLSDAGVLLIFGSDHPVGGVAYADPITGFYCATERVFRDKTPFTPDQKLDVDTAFAAYTINPAVADGMGDRLGRLERGYLADLILIEHDPRHFKAASEQENPVSLTIVNGQIVFEKN